MGTAANSHTGDAASAAETGWPSSEPGSLRPIARIGWVEHHQLNAALSQMELKNPTSFPRWGFGINPGGVLLSHAVPRAVPSALKGLTTEFGMGSGIAPSTLPPETLRSLRLRLFDDDH